MTTPTTASTTTPTDLKEWLKPVEDPELFLSLVELGLVYDATLDESGLATVHMTLTSPGCPAGGYIVDEIKKRLLENPDVKDTRVEIVWEPKWDPKVMASEECKEALGIW